MKKNLTDEKREQKNARRRAAYRKKKEDGTVKLQDENQPSLPMTAGMQRNNEEKRQENVPRHPLSDITDAYRPSSMDLDEKKEVIKARRRAAYRKKKEEANVKRQDENLSALTISDKK